MVQPAKAALAQREIDFLRQNGLKAIFRLWFQVTYPEIYHGLDLEDDYPGEVRAEGVPERAWASTMFVYPDAMVQQIRELWQAIGSDFARETVEAENLLAAQLSPEVLAAQLEYLFGHIYGSEGQVSDNRLTWKRCALWEALKDLKMEKTLDCHHCCRGLAEGITQALRPEYTYRERQEFLREADWRRIRARGLHNALTWELVQSLPHGDPVCEKVWSYTPHKVEEFKGGPR